MTHIITSLCMCDGICAEVCPTESIAAGKPQDEWPWFFIDPDTCIDCGACVPECPFDAIFPKDEVPRAYCMRPGQARVPFDTKQVTIAVGGEIVDLTLDVQYNYTFFSEGPGWDTWERPAASCRRPTLEKRDSHIAGGAL